MFFQKNRSIRSTVYIMHSTRSVEMQKFLYNFRVKKCLSQCFILSSQNNGKLDSILFFSLYRLFWLEKTAKKGRLCSLAEMSELQMFHFRWRLRKQNRLAKIFYAEANILSRKIYAKCKKYITRCLQQRYSFNLTGTQTLEYRFLDLFNNRPNGGNIITAGNEGYSLNDWF